MVKRYARTAGFALMCGLISGCLRFPSEDVSHLEYYFGEFRNGETYELLHDVFLLRIVETNGEEFLALSPEGQFELGTGRHYTVPVSMRDYQTKPKDSYETISGRSYILDTKVEGIVEAGVRLRCCVIRKYTTWSWFYWTTEWVTPFVFLLNGDGPERLVDILDLSRRGSKQTVGTDSSVPVALYSPNERLIKRIEE